MQVSTPRGRQVQSGDPVVSRQHEMRFPPSEAASFAMQTYWSASGRVWAIQSIIARTRDAVERHALEQLRSVEERRAAAAEDVLAEIWAIPLVRPD
jgi:hypothetical protein